ncbi:hypothetical protein ABB37_07027 [Leptomonas pyrrhocoris]|uniref:PPPDE domain-containing protein n=1 Tax=Leptomonas pyrrhocoris TaxID=157538 RepID=A0A0M9FX09_LEPPY|nr:hypothetical protein ABB37_07027 [Leptomonas pyrrhocoris]KPA77699.1 hypothetical protein ABB37_07027 [Leptomonas pyrrhocoris]|eukprot:XP_015656138.1 hypothetical protein ABB37_07027 [Leptomonas pyrrhocoris]
MNAPDRLRQAETAKAPFLSMPAFTTAAPSATAVYLPPTPLAASEHLRDASDPRAVLLNVYDIMGGSSFLWSIGCGIHHVGVQVYGKEYQYGYREHGTGIGCVPPRHSPPHIFHQVYCLGRTELNQAAVEELAAAFRSQDGWLGDHYHVVRHNCIDFARAFCEALLPPAVRVAQAQQAENVGLEQGRMEEVEVGGVRHAVPTLIPPHVDRLSRHAARLLPRAALGRLDTTDLPFSSLSEASHQ